MTAWLLALPAVAVALVATHVLVRRRGRGALRLLLVLGGGLLVAASVVLLLAVCIGSLRLLRIKNKVDLYR